jgi:hypothetical protein
MAEWTQADQERADLIADIACEISEDEDVVAMAIDAYDARGGTWPEWATKLLKVLEDFGNEYDADDEINLPDELAEWLHHYASDIKQTAERRRSATEDADR